MHSGPASEHPPLHVLRFVIACSVWLCTPAQAETGSVRQPAASDKAGAGQSGSRSFGLSAAEAEVDALGQRGDHASVTALAALLRKGQPDALADRALRALGNTRTPQALPVLAEFTHHRRATARRAAYAAIARIDGEPANELLALGLRDSDPEVRGSCARSLGERGGKTHLEALFRGFERGVPEAAIAIGQLCDATQLARFDAQLGTLPLAVMLGGYQRLLLRKDIAESVKLEIVARLGEVAGATVQRFFLQLLADKSFLQQPKLQRAVLETGKRIAPRSVRGEAIRP